MKSIFSLLALMSSISSIYSQEAVTSAGGNFIGSGGSSSYSIGQISYTTLSDNSQSISQGVQQSFEIQTLSDSNFSAENALVKIYPNPTSENIFLEVSDPNLYNCAYTVWDSTGKELSGGAIKNPITTITIKNFINGIYFLKVTKQNVSNKVFKIIKK